MSKRQGAKQRLANAICRKTWLPGQSATLCLVGIALLYAAPAQADLRVCNMTTSRVGLVVGHKDAQGWLTEGWFNLRPNTCDAVLKGNLNQKFYYIHGVDYDRGGEWSGRSFLCTREREFSIRGFENCLARGFDRTGFLEVDTGEQKSWTVQFTDANRTGTPPR
jgi:uncharacterized membrane protein